MTELTALLTAGEELTPARIESAAAELLDESVSDADKATFLHALSKKGETPAEIAGFVGAFLQRAIVPAIDRPALGRPLMDVCGTGGDRLDLFNVSTAGVFVLAAAGAAVIKHGNRGVSSKCGGADVLEALGIDIQTPPEAVGDCLAACGAAFLFAPRYHPAFKAVAPVRKRLAGEGQRTIFNLLGPLLNPARPDYQLLGVFDRALARPFAEILGRLGRRRAWAVHGSTESGVGMDEVSSIGTSEVWESADTGQQPRGFTIDPAALDIPPATVEELRGGDAAANAATLRGILSAKIRGPKRDLVALNAASGLVVCGLCPDLPAAWRRASETIDSGAAREVLENWRAFR